MSRHLNRLILAAVIAGGCAIAPGVTVPAGAAAAPVCPTGDIRQPDGSYRDSNQDFDDDGLPDLAAGVPSARVAGASAAGAVDVRYDVTDRNTLATTGSRSQRLIAASFPGGTVVAGARFGAASTVVDVNGDGCQDLAVGAPGADAGRGSVVIATGAPTGLVATPGIRIAGRSTAEAFGSALVGNGNDLWVGAPDRSVNGRAQAGAVDHYRVSAGTATLVETLTQGVHGIAGSPEAGDHFGAVLAVDDDDDLAIGIPDESIGTAKGAGMVSVVYPSGTTHLAGPSSTFSQNSATLSGVAEAGDHFGASVTVQRQGPSESPYVAVGVPDEQIGSLRSAGMAHVVQIRRSGAKATATQRAAISQDSATISGTPETGDRFGAAIEFAGLGVLESDVVIAAPGESLGTARAAGQITTASVTIAKSGSVTVRQKGTSIYRGAPGSANLGGSYRAGDGVGTVLSQVALPRDSDGCCVFDVGGADIVATGPGVDVGAATDAGTVFLQRRTPLVDSTGTVAGEAYGVPAFVVPTNGIDGD